jgi:quinol monooxygenase YgiN
VCDGSHRGTQPRSAFDRPVDDPYGEFDDPREGHVKFVQTISYTTTKIDELRALSDRWNAENPQAPGLVGVKVLQDRDRENAFMIVVEFESYDLAMENSARPETGAFANEMSALVDGPPTFGNYDVIDEDSGS